MLKENVSYANVEIQERPAVCQNILTHSQNSFF